MGNETESYWIDRLIENWNECAADAPGEEGEELRKFNADQEHELNLKGYRNWSDAEEEAFERWFLDYFADPEFIIDSLGLWKYELWSVDEKKGLQWLLKTRNVELRSLLKSAIGIELPCYDLCGVNDENDYRNVHYALIVDGMDWDYLDDYHLALCFGKHPEVFSIEGMRAQLVGFLEKQKEGLGYYKDCLCPSSDEFFATNSIGIVEMNDAYEAHAYEMENVCLWAELMAKKPDLAKYCPDLNGLSGFSRCYLISQRPEFERRFDLSELGNPASDCWTNPKVAKDATHSRCRYVTGWNMLVSRWTDLLTKQEFDMEVGDDSPDVPKGKCELPTDVKWFCLQGVSRMCRNVKVKKSLLEDLPHKVFTGVFDGRLNLKDAKVGSNAGENEGGGRVKVLFSYAPLDCDDEGNFQWSDKLVDYVIVELPDEQALMSMINSVGTGCYDCGDMGSGHKTHFSNYGKNAVEILSEDEKTCAVWVILESDPAIDIRTWDWERLNELHGRFL